MEKHSPLSTHHSPLKKEMPGSLGGGECEARASVVIVWPSAFEAWSGGDLPHVIYEGTESQT